MLTTMFSPKNHFHTYFSLRSVPVGYFFFVLCLLPLGFVLTLLPHPPLLNGIPLVLSRPLNESICMYICSKQLLSLSGQFFCTWKVCQKFNDYLTILFTRHTFFSQLCDNWTQCIIRLHNLAECKRFAGVPRLKKFLCTGGKKP